MVLTLAGWSVTPVFIGYLSRNGIDAWTNNGWRYALAAIVWAPLILFTAWRGKLPPRLMRRALIPAAINSVAQTLFTRGFYSVDPTLFVIGLRLQIVFVAIGAAILFPGERAVIRTRSFILGSILATLGIVGVLFFGLRDTAAVDSPEMILGMTLAVLSGACFGGYALAVRHVMQGVPSPLAFAAIAQHTAVAMVAIMLFASPDHGLAPLGVPPIVLTVLLISTFTGIAGTHVFYYMSINRIGVAVTTAVLQLQPFGVGIISYFVLHEELSLPQWACGLVAIAGAALALWVQARLRRRPGSPDDLDAYAELPVDAVVASCIDEREPAPPAGTHVPAASDNA